LQILPRASRTDHPGQGREENHGLYHARASSQPGNNGEALPAASSEASRPLHPTDAAAQYHALLIFNPPDSDDSEDSELTIEELVEAIIESTCMSNVDDWGPDAITHMVANPVFTILRTAKANALLLFPDGTHGVYLQADVHEAYRRLGRQRHTRPDPAALPTRKNQRVKAAQAEQDEIFWKDLAVFNANSDVEEHSPSLSDANVSSSVPSRLPSNPPADYPLVPRAAWMREDDPRTDAEADADWRAAMQRLFPSEFAPPLPAWRQAQVDALPTPPTRPPPWPAPAWGANPQPEPSHEPDSYLSHRTGHRTVMIRAIDPDHLLRHEPPSAPGPRLRPTQGYESDDSLESYASHKSRRSRLQRALPDPTTHAQPMPQNTSLSSFRGGTAANAFCTVRDPSSPDPLATRSIIVGLDSYSDVTVAHREIAYHIHRVAETVQTGAGEATYQEEGLVDIVDGLCSYRAIPALIAQTHAHLPSSTHLLLGVQQINDLDIKCDVHRKQRRLPLQSYDPDSDFAFDVTLQCRLAEKDLMRWAEFNPEIPVGTVRYSYLDVDVNPALSADEHAAIVQAGADFASVFDAAKGSLPALAAHPPVDLNFKSDWKHVSVPTPKWGPGAITVLTRWANEMLGSPAAYTLSLNRPPHPVPTSYASPPRMPRKMWI
jgi:hypothetical protein